MEKRSLTWLQTKHSHTLIQVVNRVFVVHILLIQVIEPTKKYKCDIQLSYNNRKTLIIFGMLRIVFFLPLLRLVMLLYVVVVLVVKLIVVKGRGGRREA